VERRLALRSIGRDAAIQQTADRARGVTATMVTLAADGAVPLGCSSSGLLLEA